METDLTSSSRTLNTKTSWLIKYRSYLSGLNIVVITPSFKKIYLGGDNINHSDGMNDYDKDIIESHLRDNIGKDVVVNLCPYPQSNYINWIQIMGPLNTYEKSDGGIAFSVGGNLVYINFELDGIRDVEYNHDRLVITLEAPETRTEKDIDDADWWKKE